MWFFILLQQHVIHPRPGWCELDPQLLIKDIREVCNECIKGELEVSSKKLRTFQSIILACAFVWDIHVSGSCVIISHYTLWCLGWQQSLSTSACPEPASSMNPKHGSHLALNFSSPFYSWSSLSLSVWCPVKCCFGDCLWCSPQNLS